MSAEFQKQLSRAEELLESFKKEVHRDVFTSVLGVIICKNMMNSSAQSKLRLVATIARALGGPDKR